MIKKILIIDDSVFSQKVTGNLIKKFLNDVEIYYAKDGQEGLIHYKNIKPDYTFLDLLMPKMDGKELLKLIKDFDKGAKVFIVSADVQKSVQKEMENMHVLEFINKPFNEEKAKKVCEMIRTDRNG